MAEESEKRFHTIMDKLFHAPPKPKPSSTSSAGIHSTTAGKNRVKSFSMSKSGWSCRELVGENGIKRSLVPIGSQAPLCRPWDRGDLLRRLATFKSMTWFGKPKVVSPVNCARRGWVNVEMDIIACEACGTRLLFTTPSSWTQQQVEKAAAVFSLKLDNGHKLLCPWIDNSCDESLALFPPTPAPALVEGYRERSSALLQLSALPVISSSAIDYMRSPQLEHFLASSHPPCTLGSGVRPTSISGCEDMDSESETISSNLYYQALKIIGLCGWELRLLSYVVDCEDQSTQSAKDAYPSESSAQVISGQNPNIIIYSTGAEEVAEVKENLPTLNGHQPDPASVVLDCRLCGASVGLWAFSTVPRPLELFNLITSTEVNGQINDSTDGAKIVNRIVGSSRTEDDLGKEDLDYTRGIVNSGCNGATVSKGSTSNLNLTIAGGPPPTKQNFRATVSLPIISRHLRAGFSSTFDVGNSVPSNVLCTNEENIQSASEKNNSLPHEKRHTTSIVQVARSEDVGTSKRQRIEDEINSRGSNIDNQCNPNGEFSEAEKTLRIDESECMHAEEYCNEQGLSLVHAVDTFHDCRREDPIESMENAPQDSGPTGGNDMLSEDAENAGAVKRESEAGISSLARDSKICFKDSEISKNSSMESTYTCNQHDADFSGDAIHHMISVDSHVSNQNVEGSKNIPQASVNNEAVAAHESGKELKSVRLDKTMEFDPTKQHRHFCPWITSNGSANTQGWQLTLSALDHRKDSSHGLQHTESPSTPSIYEVDDPVTSVRNLFMSRSAKKMKIAHGSS